MAKAWFDPIALIEHAYELGRPDDDWLARIVDAAAPGLDCGIGTSGMLWSLPASGGPVTSLASVTTRPELATLEPIIYREIGDAAPRYYTKVPTFLQASRLRPHDPVIGNILRQCSAALGHEIRDVSGMLVGDGGHTGVAITAFAAAPPRFTERHRERFLRIALHIGAALRLRTRAREGTWRAPDAVIDARGKTLHAEPAAQPRSARDALAEAVRATDRARGALRRRAPDEAIELWQALVAGRWTVVDWIDSDGRRLLVAHANPIGGRDDRSLSGREREVAEFLVHGRSNSEIAYALGLGVGTVSRMARDVLRKLGRARRTDLARIFGASELRTAELGDPALVMVDGAARCSTMWAQLTPSERAVVRRALEGASNSDIARERGRAERTIANQLATAYARFGVRGRAELAALLGPTPVEERVSATLLRPHDHADTDRESRSLDRQYRHRLPVTTTQ